MVAELRCLVSEQILQDSLVGLGSEQGLAIVVSGKYVMNDSHYAPKRVRFFEEEKSNGRQSVQSLTVTNVLVVPTKCHQDSTKLVNLERRVV